MIAGDGDHGFEYGGKTDLLLNADLGRLGLWNGLSVTVHAEYNFGESLNGRGGTIAPVNTALQFPGIEGDDAFDVSSVYLGQTFGESVSLLLGKINIVDIAASKPFMGDVDIDSFWNIVFAAPPSGTVPPYLLGALLGVRTKPATFGLWVYDPNSVVNESGFEDPFADGVTFRGTVEFPVTIGGRSGHQGSAPLFALAGRHNRAFERRWVGAAGSGSEDDILGAREISSLAGLAVGYEAVRRMSPLPVSKESVVPLAIATLVPILVVGATQVPVVDLLKIASVLL